MGDMSTLLLTAELQAFEGHSLTERRELDGEVQPGTSVTAPGKPSWVCCEDVVEDGAFRGTSQWLSNEDP